MSTIGVASFFAVQLFEMKKVSRKVIATLRLDKPRGSAANNGLPTKAKEGQPEHCTFAIPRLDD
jgi:hypothetical protein